MPRDDTHGTGRPVDLTAGTGSGPLWGMAAVDRDRQAGTEELGRERGLGWVQRGGQWAGRLAVGTHGWLRSLDINPLGLGPNGFVLHDGGVCCSSAPCRPLGTAELLLEVFLASDAVRMSCCQRR